MNRTVGTLAPAFLALVALLGASTHVADFEWDIPAPNVHAFAISEAERRDLVAFLESLTDTMFLWNPALSNPWK